MHISCICRCDYLFYLWSWLAWHLLWELCASVSDDAVATDVLAPTCEMKAHVWPATICNGCNNINSANEHDSYWWYHCLVISFNMSGDLAPGLHVHYSWWHVCRFIVPLGCTLSILLVWRYICLSCLCFLPFFNLSFLIPPPVSILALSPPPP